MTTAWVTAGVLAVVCLLIWLRWALRCQHPELLRERDEAGRYWLRCACGYRVRVLADDPQHERFRAESRKRQIPKTRKVKAAPKVKPVLIRKRGA